MDIQTDKDNGNPENGFHPDHIVQHQQQLVDANSDPHHLLVEMVVEEGGSSAGNILEEREGVSRPPLPLHLDEAKKQGKDKQPIQTTGPPLHPEHHQPQQQEGDPSNFEQETLLQRQNHDDQQGRLPTHTLATRAPAFQENNVEYSSRNTADADQALIEGSTKQETVDSVTLSELSTMAAEIAGNSVELGGIANRISIPIGHPTESGANQGISLGNPDSALTAAAVAEMTATTASTKQLIGTKKPPKRPRAKPGFGSRTSRTNIVETGQKRRSCVCINNKKCNEYMMKWAKVSPPEYHYVQLPKEHIPPPMEPETQHMQTTEAGKTGGSNTNGTPRSSMHLMTTGSNNTNHTLPSNTGNSNSNMSDTDIYKNGFRFATLRNIHTKNPLPKDERIALCHYHPEARPYLFWPKNTPTAQKYAIPISLGSKLGYDVNANKCQGFNADKYCYALPTYPFEEAQKEIRSLEQAFYDRVKQIQTNPNQFVRDLRQCEEELKEVHKLRQRNAELLRRLDDRRRSIKRLRSVLKVQRHTTKEVQPLQHHQQLTGPTNVTAQGTSNPNNTGHQQSYQQHSYPTGTPAATYLQQQAMADSNQQQQQVPVPTPLGVQNQQQHQQHTQQLHQNQNELFQPQPFSTQEQADQQQQQEQQANQHNWTYTQYQANPSGASSGTDSNQHQHQVQLTPVHAYNLNHEAHDPQQQDVQDHRIHHHQQQQQPSAIDDSNNPGSGLSAYAQQLEAAMAAAVAAGFKDDHEGGMGDMAVEDDPQHQQQHPHQHSHHHRPTHQDLMADMVHLDGMEHHQHNDGSGFGDDFNSEDEDLKDDDDCSDTERYRLFLGGQNQVRPRKWPRKTVTTPLISTDVTENETKAFVDKRNHKKTSVDAAGRKKAKKTVKSSVKSAKSEPEPTTPSDANTPLDSDINV